MYKEDFNLPAKVAPALDEAGRVLMKAADIIRTRGHCKGSPGITGGSRCLLAAIGEAGDIRGMPVSHSEPWHRLAAELAKRGVGPNGEVSWNDAAERTAEQVISALEAAATEQHP